MHHEPCISGLWFCDIFLALSQNSEMDHFAQRKTMEQETRSMIPCELQPREELYTKAHQRTSVCPEGRLPSLAQNQSSFLCRYFSLTALFVWESTTENGCGRQKSSCPDSNKPNLEPLENTRMARKNRPSWKQSQICISKCPAFQDGFLCNPGWFPAQLQHKRVRWPWVVTPLENPAKRAKNNKGLSNISVNCKYQLSAESTSKHWH